MEWSKIKNIIILILVGLNVFLLALVAVRESKSARYQEEARAGVLSALERSGIQFLPEKVPADMELTPLTVTRSREREQSMAQALLGPWNGRIREEACGWSTPAQAGAPPSPATAGSALSSTTRRWPRRETRLPGGGGLPGADGPAGRTGGDAERGGGHSC